MSDATSRTATGSSESPWTRRDGRPLCPGGGPPNYAENALAAVAQPLKGITTDGTVIPGLFPLEKTGVSTQAIREAAEAFLASWTRQQLATTLFPVEADEWRKWSNIHRTIMRHGMPFFGMSDEQIERAFAISAYLVDRGARGVVIACNTATAAAAHARRRRHEQRVRPAS